MVVTPTSCNRRGIRGEKRIVKNFPAALHRVRSLENTCYMEGNSGDHCNSAIFIQKKTLCGAASHQ
jgi:hypothetical protein